MATMQDDIDNINSDEIGPVTGENELAAPPYNAFSMSTTTTSHDRIAESIYDHLATSVCIDFASHIHQSLKTGKGLPLMLSLCQGEGSLSTKQQSTPEGIPSQSTLINNFEDTVAHTRQQLYPQLYKEKSKKDVMEILRKYAVDLPDDITKVRRRSTLLSGNYAATPADSDGENDDDDKKIINNQNKKKRKIGDEDDEDEDYQLEEDKDDDEMEKLPCPSNTDNKTSISTEATLSPLEAPTSSGETTNGISLGTRIDIWGNHPTKEPTNITCRCRLCGRHVSTSRFASHLDKCMGLSTRPLAGSTIRS